MPADHHEVLALHHAAAGVPALPHACWAITKSDFLIDERVSEKRSIQLDIVFTLPPAVLRYEPGPAEIRVRIAAVCALFRGGFPFQQPGSGRFAS